MTLIIVVVLILYGSLYPWQFESAALGTDVFWILLHSWPGDFDRFLLRDAIINVALYVPCGASAFLTFPQRSSWLVRYCAPVVFAAVLSLCVEMLQVFVPGRDPTLADVVTNGVGAALGVGVARGFQNRITHLGAGHLRRGDATAAGLLICWAAYLLFPLIPVLGRAALSQNLGAFLDSAPLDGIRVASSAVIWVLAGRLMGSAGVRDPSRWLPVTVLFIPLQLFVLGRQPVLSDVSGALLGCLVFALWAQRAGSVSAAALFVTLLIVRGLVPFHFQEASAFSWIPFSDFLASQWQNGALILIEKAFYYGTAIWILRSAGLRLFMATGIVASLLLGIEGLQMYLPGRTPGVTDPVMAILMGLVVHSLSGKRIAETL